MIVVAAAFAEGVVKARPNLKTAKHVIVFGGKPEELKAQGLLCYEELVANESPALDPVRRPRTAVSVLLYTSGTTGMPKGTAHYMEEALIVPDTMGKYGWNVQPEDVLCGPAPISLAGGYSTVATIPFRFGAAASLIAKFTPEGLFEQIQSHKVTILSALPTAYRKMLEFAGTDKKFDLSSLRVLTGGGESLTAKTYLDWKARFGQEIYEGLGTTEMMYVFVSSVVTRKVKPGAIGTAVPGYEIQVITEDGKVAKPGELGRLYARGPTGTLYWRPARGGWKPSRETEIAHPRRLGPGRRLLHDGRRGLPQLRLAPGGSDQELRLSDRSRGDRGRAAQAPGRGRRGRDRHSRIPSGGRTSRPPSS